MEKLASILSIFAILAPFFRRRAAGYVADYLNHRRDIRLLRDEGLEKLPELTPQARRMLYDEFQKEQGGVQPSAGLAILSGLVGAVFGAAAYWRYLNSGKS